MASALVAADADGTFQISKQKRMTAVGKINVCGKGRRPANLVFFRTNGAVPLE